MLDVLCVGNLYRLIGCYYTIALGCYKIQGQLVVLSLNKFAVGWGASEEECLVCL